MKKESSKPSKTRVPVSCDMCGRKWRKRLDTLNDWSGRCPWCSSIEVAKMPHVKAAMRECGIRVMKKVGQLPHPIEKYRRGSNHPNWRGGITPYRVKIWTSPQYKSWREAVFKRDSFQCVVCRINTHDLEADHIKPFALFPELRFDVSNGRTMCKPCHRAYGANVRHGRLVNQASFRYAVESK